MITELQPKFTFTNRITTGLIRIEQSTMGFLETATMSENWIRKINSRVLVLESHHTTHIKGVHVVLGKQCHYE